MKAYFSYANAQHGVNGRQIVFKFDDDGYNPANTVQMTHKYVEQDHAFALVGGLGTEPQQAVEAYLNQQKVPQLFVSTGATDLRPRLREVPVDDRLAAGLRGRGRDLRQVHRQEPAEREDRRSSTRTTITAATT